MARRCSKSDGFDSEKPLVVRLTSRSQETGITAIVAGLARAFRRLQRSTATFAVVGITMAGVGAFATTNWDVGHGNAKARCPEGRCWASCRQ